jgi:phage FluMu protein Com
MKQTNEKVYRCDHCNKAMISKGFMAYHEKWCKNNPKNYHKCFEFCENLIKGKNVIETGDQEQDQWEIYFKCKATDKLLYSYKIEKKFCNRPEILKERIEGLQRMPTECDDFTDQEDVIENLYND